MKTKEKQERINENPYLLNSIALFAATALVITVLVIYLISTGKETPKTNVPVPQTQTATPTPTTTNAAQPPAQERPTQERNRWIPIGLGLAAGILVILNGSRMGFFLIRRMER